MAGDRGMRYPELTAGALQHLETSGCSDGYSTSRTCEMSLSNHSGINFRGLVYLIDEVWAGSAGFCDILPWSRVLQSVRCLGNVRMCCTSYGLL